MASIVDFVFGFGRVLAFPRPVPARPGWARDSRCRVLAGCYETLR